MSRNCLNMLHNNRSALKNLIISGSLHTQIHPHHLNTVSLERFCVCPRNFGGESALAVFLRTQRELKELTIMHPRKLHSFKMILNLLNVFLIEENSNDLVSAIMGHPSLETFELIMGKEWFYKDIQRLSNSKITTLKLQIKQASSVQQAKMVSTSFLKLERLELNLHETRTFAGMNDERHTDISVDFNLHPSLQYISVCMENLTYEGLRQLRMDKLKKFEWRYNKYKVTIDWDAFAQKNPNIEEFYLKGIPLTNIDLEHITRNLKNLQVFEYDPSNNSTEWEMQYVLNVKSLPIILNNCLNLRLLKMKLKKLINPSTANPVYSTWSYGQGNKDDIALLELQPRLDKLESYEFTLDGKIKNREYFNKD